VVTIDEVRSELEAMKKDAIEVKVEDL